ncbi:hypothetical protein AALP_AA6G225500 [Arabis alpina]|uniref:Uncharacterized protein n=1 Tax=Arabis alpina TaxID=50452 RepID=A0A087GR07_ARAAL|nr:hypothetical protein AALP_AA6G225500 [Arabis alpina]
MDLRLALCGDHRRKFLVWFHGAKSVICFTQNLEFDIDGKWLEFWLDNHDLKLPLRLCTKDIMILVYTLNSSSKLSLYVKTYAGCLVALMPYVAQSVIQLDTPPIISGVLCSFLVSKSIKHEVYHSCEFISFSLFVKTSKGCSEVLFIYVAKRLLLLDDPQTSGELLCDNLVCLWSLQPEFRRYNGQFTKMETTSDQCCFLFSLLSWLIWLQSHSSSSCVTSQGELWSSRIHSMTALTNGIDSGFITPKIEHIFSSHALLKRLSIVANGGRTNTTVLLHFIALFVSRIAKLNSDVSSVVDADVGEQVEALLQFNDGTEFHQFEAMLLLFRFSLILHSSFSVGIHGYKKSVAEAKADMAKMQLFLDSPVLIQGQSRAYAFLGITIVACSGWFGFILEFFFFSLPRPPDHRCDFSSPSPSIHMTFTRRWGVLMSQVMALKIVSHSGGLHNILSFFYGSLSRPPEDQFFSFTPPLFT